jgi:hypothetical protein
VEACFGFATDATVYFEQHYFNGLQAFAKTAPQLCFTSNSIQVMHEVKKQLFK